MSITELLDAEAFTCQSGVDVGERGRHFVADRSNRTEPRVRSTGRRRHRTDGQGDANARHAAIWGGRPNPTPVVPGSPASSMTHVGRGWCAARSGPGRRFPTSAPEVADHRRRWLQGKRVERASGATWAAMPPARALARLSAGQPGRTGTGPTGKRFGHSLSVPEFRRSRRLDSAPA